MKRSTRNHRAAHLSCPVTGAKMVARNSPHTTGQLSLWDRVALVGFYPLFGNCKPRFHITSIHASDLNSCYRKLICMDYLSRAVACYVWPPQKSRASLAPKARPDISASTAGQLSNSPSPVVGATRVDRRGDHTVLQQA